jgi:RNA polymerase sigma factor (sigma-70 family)
MEVSALRYSGGISLHARSPLLRLQSDERLVTLIRRGSTTAFEVLVARYHSRLLAFCRHLLGSREDAEDVLQEVFSAAFNALLDDDRPINVRPWLYRIARNRSLNHLRRIQAVGVDSMDIHLSEHGTTTADKVHDREEFRLLVVDIHGLPETQRTALVLREMDALSYEQIAEAMETTVPSVKSLLVRARVSLAEAAEARLLTCEQVRVELAEVAEGLQRRPGPLVRRHIRACERCATFKGQLNETSKALTAVLPVGGFVLLRKLAILHIGHSAGAGAGAGSGASGASAGSTAAAVGGTAAAGAGAVMGTSTTGFLSASVGAIATKAAAGLAAAALVTAGAVEVEQPARPHVHHHASPTIVHVASVPSPPANVAATVPSATPSGGAAPTGSPRHTAVGHPHKPAPAKTTAITPHKPVVGGKHRITATTKAKTTPTVPAGRTQTQTDSTVLGASPTAPATTTTGAAGTTPCPATNSASTAPASPAPAPTTTSQSADTSSTGLTPDPTSTAPSGAATTTPATTAPASSPDPGQDSSCAGDSTGAATTTGTSPSTTASTPTTTATTPTTTATTTTTTATTTTTTATTTTTTTTSTGSASSAGSALGAGAGVSGLAAHVKAHRAISFRRDRRRAVHRG